MVYTERSFTWQKPCTNKARRKYTTRVAVQKLQSPIQNSMRQKRSESAGERRIAPFKSDQQLLITDKELWTGSFKGLNADHVLDMSYHSAVNDLQQSTGVCEHRLSPIMPPAQLSMCAYPITAISLTFNEWMSTKNSHQELDMKTIQRNQK